MHTTSQTNVNTLLPLERVLPFIILFEGFASIAVEILTIRQLQPVAGGSIIVTSLIIGVFLLFLALGYQQGGHVALFPHKKLCINFLLAAGGISLGLSYIFIDLFFYGLQKIVGPHIIYPLLAYLLLITAPLIYILGQTVPMTMGMIKHKASIGKIGGNILSLSTLGSFLGAIITTLFFMQYLGVAWTIVCITSALLFLTLLLAENKTTLFFHGINVILVLSISYAMNIHIEKRFFVLTDNYANYQIQNKETSKVLIINDTLSSSINTKQAAFPYIEAIKKIIFSDLKIQNADILVLGAGGFTLSAQQTQHNRFTYVDIDKKISQVVFPHFLKHANSQFIADDARHYLQTTDITYSVIINDVYNDTKAIPANLITQEYMRALKQRLTPQGIAIFNVIANPSLSDAYSKGIDNTIRSVFDNCMAMPMVYADKITNIVYACRNSFNNDKHIYTDNLNHSTTDAFSW